MHLHKNMLLALLLGHNLNCYHLLNQRCLISMNINLCSLSLKSKFSAWTLLKEITSFITALSQCSSKNPFISRLFREIFIHTCISIILSKCLLNRSAFFARKQWASFSHTSRDQANINILKQRMQQCFTFILMVYQMLFISHGVVPNMGLTPQ